MRRMNRVQAIRSTSDGYRSGYEGKVAKDLQQRQHPFAFEAYRIRYTVPARDASYTPDWLLANNIVVESKGYPWDAADRQKMLLVKQQYPDLDVRMLFQKASNKIYPKSKTTFADWCEEHGFQYAEGFVPPDWLREPWKPLHPALIPKKAK